MTGNALEIINWLYKQDKDKFFKIEEKKDKRTIQQNRLLWELINKIAKFQGQDDMEIYCLALEQANAKTEYVISSEEMSEALRKSFRGVKFIRMQEVNDKDCYVYKVYLGSSKMNKQEFKELLDIVLDWCSQLGIETTNPNEIKELEYLTKGV